MINTDVPSGQPVINARNRKVQVNSTLELTCDDYGIDGSITWYSWSFANGTFVANTTEKTWIYKVKDKEETLRFECIAGNAWGQSSKSRILDIEVTAKAAGKDFSLNKYFFHYLDLAYFQSIFVDSVL